MARVASTRAVIWISCLLSMALANTVVRLLDSANKPAGETVQVPVSEDVVLNCVVENKPWRTPVRWYRVHEGMYTPLTNDAISYNPWKYAVGRPAPVTWRLTVKHVFPEDEGTYGCQVQLSSQNYVRDEISLVVVESPVIYELETSSDTTVIRGDAVQLQCAARGRPNPDFTWSRVDNQMMPGGSQQVENAKFTIPQVRLEDAGDYKCHVNNSVGSLDRVIKLRVLP